MELPAWSTKVFVGGMNQRDMEPYTHLQRGSFMFLENKSRRLLLPMHLPPPCKKAMLRQILTNLVPPSSMSPTFSQSPNHVYSSNLMFSNMKLLLISSTTTFIKALIISHLSYDSGFLTAFLPSSYLLPVLLQSHQ